MIFPSILLLAIAGQWIDGEENISAKNASCYCGLYNGKLSDSQLPILSRDTLLEVLCNAEGETVCKDYCQALAELFRPNGPKAICEEIKEAQNLKIHLYSKACTDGRWIETGFKASRDICCDSSKPVNCTGPA